MHATMKTDYALRALTELALHHGEIPLRVGIIAGRRSIPEAFLAQLLTQLRHVGLVRSARGPHGGHTLSRDPHEIRLADVVRAIEGSAAQINGLDRTEGPGMFSPTLKPVLLEVETAAWKILEGITLADLVKKERTRSINQYVI